MSIISDWLTQTAAMVHEQGYRVTPVFKNGSAKKYANGETYTDQGDYRDAVAVGVVLDDVVLLDYDGNKADAAGEPIVGLDELAAMLGLDEMPQPVQEGSTGRSLHFLFRLPPSFNGKASYDGWRPYIDLKTGNQLMHLKQHKLLNDDELPRREELPTCPQALLDALAASGFDGAPRDPWDGSEKQLREPRAVLEHISPDLPYDEWVMVLMGIHERFGNSAEGIDLADNWSAGGSNYSGRKVIAYKFSTFKNTGGITFASLCKRARESGADLATIGNRSFDDGSFEIKPPPEPLNPFSDYSAPPFPIDVLPDVLRVYAEECSQQSGLDVGAYAFCLLVQAANSADHRSRLEIAKGFSVSPNIFGGLVSASGEGKSPIISAASKFSAEIDGARVMASKKAKAEWRQQCKQMKGQDELPPEPPWRQRSATDATVEALAGLASTNADGIYMVWHEITELIGRMDAYSKDAGKDRGRYIAGYDCGQLVVNRATKDPLVVDNFSLGILAGIQPEVLANFLKKTAASDGLYQRFLIYAAAPQGKVDLFAERGSYTDSNASMVFNNLEKHRDRKPISATLNDDGRLLLQQYQNDIRVIASGTAAPRFAEHLGKFAGLAGRITLALHLMHAAAAQSAPETLIPAERVQNALSVMRCLYRHSERVYSVLDNVNSEVYGLIKSAAEAILAKGWTRFARGDLTRDATYWKAADNHQAENAIDLLSELNWVTDVTDVDAPKRGRRSLGKFEVNPRVHELFRPHAQQISAKRAKKYDAIRKAAADRAH